MKKLPRPNALHGFTLIELLVVIAIISLLVSILLPSLSRAKDLARRTVCAANLRGLTMALALYAEQADGQYPLQFGEVHKLGGGGGMTYKGYIYGVASAEMWQWGSLCTLGQNQYLDPRGLYCPGNEGVGCEETGWPGPDPNDPASGDRYWGNYTYFGGKTVALHINALAGGGTGAGRFPQDLHWTPISPADNEDPNDWLLAADYHNWAENQPSFNASHNFSGNNCLYHDQHVEWVDPIEQAVGKMTRRPGEDNLVPADQFKYWRF